MPTGEDGRLASHEAERLRAWIIDGWRTVNAFAEEYEYSPAALSRMLNRKPDGGISINRLRDLVRRTGHTLSELFEEEESAPRKLTLADVQAGLQQASVNMSRWATLLQEVQREGSVTPQPTTPSRLMSQARGEAQRLGVVDTKKTQASQEAPDAVPERPRQSADAPSGTPSK